MGYSPWSHKELDTTDQLHFHFHFSHLQAKALTYQIRKMNLKEIAYFVKYASALGLIVGRSQDNMVSKDLLSQMDLGNKIFC